MKPLRILIGCERFGAIRRACRALGHDAWSCDIEPADDGSPYHICDDVLRHIDDEWDLFIAHPSCKFLANSGAKHLYSGMRKENGPNPERWKQMRAGAEFYVKLWRSKAKRVAIENPVIHCHAAAVIAELAPDHPRRRHFVQPWWFGHPETKATGFALRNLPPLIRTNDVRAQMLALPYKDRSRIHYMSPGPDRERLRSKTYPGLAAAIAEQWCGPAVAEAT